MSTSYEVISDFLDDETFDPQALGKALADPGGREMLIDLVILRYAAQRDDAPSVEHVPIGRRRPMLVAAAAVVLALAGGYQVGQWRTAPELPQPPAATRVVPVEWQALPAENIQ